MDETTKTEAVDLDAAASEAVESQTQTTQETEEVTEVTETPETTGEEQVAETTEEVVEELDKEGLPVEHKDRSDLGRKTAAVHRRMDGLENKATQNAETLSQILSLLQEKPEEESSTNALEPGEPTTREDVVSIVAAEKKKETTATQAYQETYTRTVSSLGPNLSQEEFDAVLAEMETMRYNASDNAQMDAEMNFQKAENIWLRKKMAKPIERTNPIKGETVKGKLGVTTNQKTVAKETVAPKLDSYGQSYVDYVRRQDGDEGVEKLLAKD